MRKKLLQAKRDFLCCIFILVIVCFNLNISAAEQITSSNSQNSNTTSNTVGSTADFVNSNTNVNSQISSATEPAKPWYDVEKLKDYGSLAAVIIALAAFIFTRISSKEEKVRQKREELRKAVEKLVSLREEFNNNFGQIVDPAQRFNLSASSKTKTDIYLLAAETLEKDISKYVSYVEYMVIAQENVFDSDFEQARKYYQKAVKASELTSSITAKQITLRGLAYSYFNHYPQNINKGRESFEKALKILEKCDEKDYYSLSAIARTYREWGDQEALAGHRKIAQFKYKQALETVMRIPEWYNLKQEEMRVIANSWKILANGYFVTFQGEPVNNPDIEKARLTYQLSLKTIENLVDDNTVDLRGQIYTDWAYNEILYGSEVEGEKYHSLGVQNFSSLPENYPNKVAKLKWIESMLPLAKSRKQSKEKTPLEKSPEVSTVINPTPQIITAVEPSSEQEKE